MMTPGRRFWLAAALAGTPLAVVAQPTAVERCGLRVPSTEQGGFIGLPSGDVFCPLIADPKTLRSFLSYLRKQATTGDSLTTIGSVGIADAFGIARWGGHGPGSGVQLSIAGSIFAQFDLASASYDLINADYIIGIPLTMRSGPVSARFRIYHQSSHLGDEYLLRGGDPDRVNVAFEGVEAILSIDARALRLYGGGEYLINREPESLERYVAHAGAELRPSMPLMRLPALGTVRFIAAGDFKASQEQDWKPSVSARGGFEFDRPGSSDPGARRWSVLFESYSGPSPYGQFFRRKIQYIGAGVHFQL